MALFQLLHLLAALIWVGGMFFAYVVLRPAAVQILEPPQRLRLWHSVFTRFFVWVWSAIVVLLVTGFYLIYLFGGMGHAPRHVHIMLTLGIVMIAIFVYVFRGCYVPLGQYVSQQRWEDAGQMLGRIRKLVAANLTLGLTTVAVATIGRFWG
ncbi:MAG TPA: CopD family protein [Gallionella sp.]|nr:CopD family protein [Gallionella sp.]